MSTDLNDMAMVPVTTFDPVTGHVLQSGTMSRGVAQHLIDMEGNHIIGEPPPNSYVDVKTKKFVTRKPCPAKVKSTTFSSLPKPCMLEVHEPNGAYKAYDCADGTAELEFDLPGEYTIYVFSVPYLDGKFTVTAP